MVEPLKQCIKCEEHLPLDAFSPRNKYNSTLRARCKQCYNTELVKWRRNKNSGGCANKDGCTDNYKDWQ